MLENFCPGATQVDRAKETNHTEVWPRGSQNTPVSRSDYMNMMHFDRILHMSEPVILLFLIKGLKFFLAITKPCTSSMVDDAVEDRTPA